MRERPSMQHPLPITHSFPVHSTQRKGKRYDESLTDRSDSIVD